MASAEEAVVCGRRELGADREARAPAGHIMLGWQRMDGVPSDAITSLL